MYTISMYECVRARALRVVYVHMYVSVCRVHMHAHNFTAICVRLCAWVCLCVCLCFIFYLFSLMRQRNAIKTWYRRNTQVLCITGEAPSEEYNKPTFCQCCIKRFGLLFLRFQFDDVLWCSLLLLLVPFLNCSCFHFVLFVVACLVRCSCCCCFVAVLF